MLQRKDNKSFINNEDIKYPDYLEPDEIIKIQSFLQGATYVWCALKNTEEFAARNLIGGINYFWEKTPLEVLHNHYISEQNSEKLASLDLGICLKKTLAEDKRTFYIEYREAEKRTYYTWDGNRSNDCSE